MTADGGCLTCSARALVLRRQTPRLMPRGDASASFGLTRSVLAERRPPCQWHVSTQPPRQTEAAAYDWHHTDLMLDAYRVVEVRSADGAPAPPEITQRFQGRLWTLHQLEERGVRITGASAWYLAAGKDWQLKVEPAV